MHFSFFTVFLKNRDIISKIKRSKVTDYAALIGVDYTIEPVHDISNNVVCATTKASDQPAHTRSLIRAFASRSSIL